MSKVRKEFLSVSIVVALALVVALIIHLASAHKRIDDMEESIAAAEQARAEVWQTVDGLKGKMRILDGGHKVLLIMGTGQAVIIRTEDGQTLRCYFPDDPTKKETE
ncbi:hypothetical protein KAR91_23370 [Candidatus Pacearchaeota archaeon]|nr:hypothetical protein [Candidatus Pacearchaeota archaeon]